VRRLWYRICDWFEYSKLGNWLAQIWFCHHNARVLADMEVRMARVIHHATGTMSKPYYTLESMLAEIDDRSNTLYDEAYKEGRESNCQIVCNGGLTFDGLREACLNRQSMFKELCGHWTISDWMLALTGEVGEAANIIKKTLRGDFTLEQARTDIGKELADIQIYLAIVAIVLGIDLGDGTVEKFNEVCVRRGLDMRLVVDEAVVEEVA
jgi:NTP pyrophosphatase (non-canonical NTP hydrolase)